MKTFRHLHVPQKILIGLVAFVCVACELLGPGLVPPKRSTFLTGECLLDGRLLPQDPNTYHLQYSVTKDAILIPLHLNLDSEDVFVSRKENLSAYFPSANVFNSFGPDSKQVYNDFYAIFDNQVKPYSSTVTIYYGGNIIITSNAEVCGIAAGENLYPSVAGIKSSSSYKLPEDTIPDGYEPLDYYFNISISAKGRNIVDGTPTFYISIPVKVGMYLSYLNEKRTNPEAKMQYRDEVLTGAVSIDKNIQ